MNKLALYRNIDSKYELGNVRNINSRVIFTKSIKNKLITPDGWVFPYFLCIIFS